MKERLSKIRINTKAVSLYLAVCLFAVASWAQVDETDDHHVDGVENTQQLIAVLPKSRLAPHLRASQIELPRTERPAAGWSGYEEAAGVLIAGYVAPAPPDLMRQIRWSRQPDGSHIGAIELRSKDAKSLRVRFTGDFGRNGEELRVYDPKGGSAFGPYSLPMMDEEGNWWTTIIFGDRIGLEFYVPAEVDKPQLPEISGIVYNFEGYDAIIGDSEFHPAGCAHRDVACEADWRDTEARGVCMLATVLANGNVSGFCSGATLNRNPSDFAPVIMTANHCVGTQASANATAFVWNFQNTTCNGTPPNPNTLPRSTGSILLKRHAGSDWNLLGSYEQLGTNFYLGWTSSGSWSSGSAATGIHHPGGTFKRISFGSLLQADDDRCFCPAGVTTCDTNQGCFLADVWSVSYTTGFTAPGSSGSPLMDGNRQVRGTLSGGPNDCATSRYGRLSDAFVNVRYYIFEMANPTFVNAGVAGDGANNQGNSERGTAANPFNQVYEATFCVPTGGTVRIVPGSYNQRFTVWRAMTLMREGSSGVVRIGAP